MKKKNIKKRIAALILALSMSFLCGCETFDAFKSAFIDPPVESDAPVIKIGVLEPLTGLDADDAADEVAGIKFANAYLPSFGSARVELVFSDNQSDVTVCPVAAQYLIDQEVDFIIGSSKSVLTLASSDVIAAAKIPAIAVTNMNPIITSTNPYYFRVCYIDSYEGTGASEFAIKSLRSSHCAVVTVEGNDYAAAVAAEFADKYKEKILSIYDQEPQSEQEAKEKGRLFDEDFDREAFNVESVVLPADASDYRLYFEYLERKGVDTIFFPSTITQASTVIEQIRGYGFRFNWIGTSTWNGLKVNDVYYTMDFDPKAELSDVAKNFTRAYEKEFGEGAKASEAFALSFDAYLLIREAVLAVGPNASKRKFAEALSSIENMSGATGSITMGAGGDPIKDLLVEHYINGDFEVEYTVKGFETTRDTKMDEQNN